MTLFEALKLFYGCIYHGYGERYSKKPIYRTSEELNREYHLKSMYICDKLDGDLSFESYSYDANREYLEYVGLLDNMTDDEFNAFLNQEIHIDTSNPHRDPDKILIDVPEFFYHVVPISALYNIKSQGLKQFPTDLWCWVRPYNNGYRGMKITYLSATPQIAYFIYGRYNTHSLGSKLLKIDTKKLPEATLFFLDPEVKYAYYTNTHIPPEALSLEE